MAKYGTPNLDTLLDNNVYSYEPDDKIEPVLKKIVASNATTASHAANTVYFVRFRLRETKLVTGISIYHGATVAGSGAIGIYTFAGGTMTKLASSADAVLAGASAVTKYSFASPASVQLAPNTDYYATFGFTDATMTFLRQVTIAGVGLENNDVLSKATTYSAGLPTPIASVVAGGTIIPWFELRTN